jgi:hypothetical protein
MLRVAACGFANRHRNVARNIHAAHNPDFLDGCNEDVFLIGVSHARKDIAYALKRIGPGKPPWYGGGDLFAGTGRSGKIVWLSSS